MSHERVGPRTSVSYVMPSRPSDTLRTLAFAQFFEQYRGAAFSVRTMDGWAWSSSPLCGPVLLATFENRELLDAVINDSTETSLGRVFLNGDLDVQGDPAALLAISEYVFRRSGRLGKGWTAMVSRAGLDLFQRVRTVRGHTALKNWRADGCSYDLPVSFFEQWLGPSLVCACGRFLGPDDGLDAGESRALDRVCDLLELKRGDRLLDLGCGWGGLLVHAAERARAETWGITSSEQRASICTERIREHGLEHHSVAECRDLRARPFPAESFDTIADIGFFERPAIRHLQGYLACARKTLTPGGLFLVDRLVRPPGKAGGLDTDLFPNGELGSLSMEIEAAESAGLEVRSVENLRKDYEQTLRFWIGNLQRAPERHAAQAPARSYRKWLLYLLEVATAFQAGDLDVYQLLLRRALPT